jgi:hypothetical protein
MSNAEKVMIVGLGEYFTGCHRSHCVMSNIEIHSKVVNSDILKAIEFSNM